MLASDFLTNLKRSNLSSPLLIFSNLDNNKNPIIGRTEKNKKDDLKKMAETKKPKNKTPAAEPNDC